MQSSGGFEINRNRDRAREVQGRGRFRGTFELSAGKRTLPDAGGQAELICDPQKKSQASVYLREHVVVLLPAQFAGTWKKKFVKSWEHLAHRAPTLTLCLAVRQSYHSSDRTDRNRAWAGQF